MFENLSDRLQSAIHKMIGYGKITEENINEVMKEIRQEFQNKNWLIARQCGTHL